MKAPVVPKAMVGLLTLLVLGLAGCQKPSTATAFPIQVELDAALRGKSVLVDLVGVNQGNLERWSSYSMTGYWQDGDLMRANAIKKTCNFTSGASLTDRLDPGDPVWTKWKEMGVARVFVLADLPGVHADQPGAQDPRRQILDLRSSYWVKGTTELRVLVKESGIEVVTPPRALRVAP